MLSMVISYVFYQQNVYIKFDEENFFYLVLPPIIFAGGIINIYIFRL